MTSAKSTSSKKPGKPGMLRKHTKIVLWGLGVIVLLTIFIVSFFMYDRYIGFGAPAHPDFVGYRPTILPNNITVTGQSLTREHMEGLDIWNFFYTPTLSNKDLTIHESQRNPAEPDTVSCRGYGGMCVLHHTPKGYVYRIWYNTNNTRPFDVEISWTEGNTDVTIAVNNDASKYLQYNWDAVFDTMQPIDLSHMTYTKHNTCQCGG